MNKPVQKLGFFEYAFTAVVFVVILIIYENNDTRGIVTKATISIIFSIALNLGLKSFQEWKYNNDLEKYTKKFCGSFVRITIGQDIESRVGENKEVQRDNNGLSIEISYVSPLKVKVISNYWKSKNAVVEAQLDIIDSSTILAQGKYKYINSDDASLLNHVGFYYIHSEDNLKTYDVLWSQHFPRHLLHNKGFEKWKKV